MSMKTTAVLVAVLTVGCSTGHAKTGAHATSAPDASAHATPSAVTSSATAADALLARRLVRASDLPAGYIKDKQTKGTSLAASNSDSACARSFAGVSRLATSGALAPLAHAQASFSRKSSPNFIRASAYRYRDAASATRVVTAVHDVFARCRSFTATNPTNKRVVSVALSPLPFPHLGDGGAATDGTLTANGQHVYIDLVFVRSAASIAYVAGLTTGQRDFVALKRAARMQLKRLGSS